MTQKPQPQHREEDQGKQAFLSLFLTHQRRLFSFILMLVPRRADAEDLMQKSAMVMMQKFDQFRPDSNFAAWAMKIIRYEILKYREQNQRLQRQFDQAVFMELVHRTEARLSHMDQRLDALEICLQKLNDRDRELLKLRYGDSKTVKEVASQLNRPIQGMYKVMARIHRSLRNCVDKNLIKEGLASS